MSWEKETTQWAPDIWKGVKTPHPQYHRYLVKVVNNAKQFKISTGISLFPKQPLEVQMGQGLITFKCRVLKMFSGALRRAAPGLTAFALVLRWCAPFSPPEFHTHSAASSSFLPWDGESEHKRHEDLRFYLAWHWKGGKTNSVCLHFGKVILHQISRFTSNRTITTIFKSYVLEIPLYWFAIQLMNNSSFINKSSLGDLNSYKNYKHKTCFRNAPNFATGKNDY